LAQPRTPPAIPQPGGAPLLRVIKLKKYFPVRRGLLQRVIGHIKAVDDVSLNLQRGETLGLVGESGCGKSTLGRTVLRLVEPSSGQIEFEGLDITRLPHRRLKALRKDMQMIFQDPIGSLDPRMTVADIVSEGLLVHGMRRHSDREETAREMLERVGLRREHADRFPHEFSGGQRQRIGIARALALSPKLIVADEPVSALDVSIQSQVLNLLVELKREFGLTYIFVAHNLAVVAYISDRIAVMYLGKIVELAQSAELYQHPLHPYTTTLLSAIPVADPEHRRDRIKLTGDVPSPFNPPTGCHFRTRCPLARKKGTQDGICAEVEPPLTESRLGHTAACHFAGESF
jgi:oligopeptide/dipeptide ABC transporter ATP-binding protein